MTISSHHHLRNGDRVALTALQTAARMGARDLVWFPSASFPCHEPVIELMKSGAVHHIEGSMNGPLGDYCSHGHMSRPGRACAPTADAGRRSRMAKSTSTSPSSPRPSADFFGNADGSHGKSACGSLGFALADSIYADRVIVVTDNLVPFPCVPWQIQGNNVDYVVEVDSIGDPAKIVSGTTQITRSPDRLRIARARRAFLRDSGIMRDGFSFQAGAGGIALAFVDYLARMMKESRRQGQLRPRRLHQVSGRPAERRPHRLHPRRPDLRSRRACAPSPAILATSPPARSPPTTFTARATSPRWSTPCVLGATEVDVNFNANVVTHSDGRLLHGIGGWQNCLFAGCTILAVPSFRDRIPVIVDEVTTITGPGELIDVIVTERGIAINPKRQDLLDAVKGKGLPDPPHRGDQGRGREDLRRQARQSPPARRSRRRREMGGRHRARHRMASSGRQSLRAESRRRRVKQAVIAFFPRKSKPPSIRANTNRSAAISTPKRTLEGENGSVFHETREPAAALRQGIA